MTMCRSSPKNLSFAMVYTLALEAFQYDHQITNTWWMAAHEIFDGLSPYEMTKNGRGRKVVRIIERYML